MISTTMSLWLDPDDEVSSLGERRVLSRMLLGDHGHTSARSMDAESVSNVESISRGTFVRYIRTRNPTSAIILDAAKTSAGAIISSNTHLFTHVIHTSSFAQTVNHPRTFSLSGMPCFIFLRVLLALVPPSCLIIFIFTHPFVQFDEMTSHSSTVLVNDPPSQPVTTFSLLWCWFPLNSLTTSVFVVPIIEPTPLPLSSPRHYSVHHSLTLHISGFYALHGSYTLFPVLRTFLWPPPILSLSSDGRWRTKRLCPNGLWTPHAYTLLILLPRGYISINCSLPTYSLT